MSTRRIQFDSAVANGASHAGLWLDKFARDQERGGDTSRRQLVEEVAACPEPTLYRAFYRRWEATLDAVGASHRRARVLGRMVVGTGNESVLETSITLHRTYGLPYIPGSALKGLAANYVRSALDPREWGATTDAYRTIFGTTSDAGYVVFLDALYVPGSGTAGQALHADVLAVHHREYYQSGTTSPADWDSPTLVPFVCATGQYLVALRGPAKWVQTGFDLLGAALADLGVGAKTSSGYGRLALEGYLPAPTATVPAGEGTAASTTGSGVAAPAPVRTRSTGMVRYEKGRALIRDDQGTQWRVDWKEVGLGSTNLKEKTLVEFEYEELPDGGYKVVRVIRQS